MIDHYLGTHQGFERVCAKLYRLFGRPLIIANRCEELMLSVGKIKARDSERLKEFASVMGKALVQMAGIETFSILNSLGTLRKIVDKLPDKTREDWAEWSFSFTQETKREATFRHLLGSFAEKQIKLVQCLAVLNGLKVVTERKQLTSQSVQWCPTPMFLQWKKLKPKAFKIEVSKPCEFCNEHHHLTRCPKLAGLRHFMRVEFVKKRGLCFRCLNSGDLAHSCLNKLTCSVEGCRFPNHHSLLHKVSPTRANPESITTVLTSHKEVEEKSDLSLPLLPILPVEVTCGEKQRRTYVLLDSGSQQTFCSASLLLALKVVGRDCVQIRTMGALRSGNCISGKVVDLSVRALDGGQAINLKNVMSVNRMPVERCPNFAKSDLLNWNHLRDLELPQLEDKSVELLIGIDCKKVFQTLECRIGPAKAPDAIRTPLGWVIYGANVTMELNDGSSHAALNVLIDLFRDGSCPLDSSEYSNDCSYSLKMSSEDRIALQKMKDKVKIVNGRFQLPLLWQNKTDKMSNNRKVAQMRLMSLKRRLTKDKILHERYSAVMASYFEEGYAEKLRETESHLSWFLPHYPVVNPSNPDKLRIVFDCGAKYEGTSLNKTLVRGPDLTNSLGGVLVRFREKRVTLVADVKSMFHQVKVEPKDKNFLKFLWWPEGNTNGVPEVCCMTVHIFGAKSSPSCALFALPHTVDVFAHELSDEAVQAIRRNFYVYDFLLSVSSIKEAVEIGQEVTEMLSKAGFTLHKWQSNESEVRKHFWK